MEPRKRTHKQVHPLGPAKGKVNLDANSERNALFYCQDGFSNCYPKKMVYPPEGGEFQMEQLIAKLPQYCPPPSFRPLPLQEDVGGDDMEMTMACATNITLHPVMNKENVSVIVHPKTSNAVTRRPLQQLDQPPPPLPPPSSLSPGEELERLCQEKQSQPSLESVHVGRAGEGRRKGGDSTEDIGEVLEELVLQKSVERELERGGHKENLSYLKHQENIDSVQPYPRFPVGSRDKGCVAKLNFSDAESSLGTSGQLSSLMEDSVGASLLSHSQIRNLEQSGRAGQSFEVFHDSWRSQSQNASHGGRSSAFQPVSRQQGVRYFGKPLERKPLQEMQASHQHESDLSSFADSYSQSQSLTGQPSQSNMSSFSAFEESREQSSFVPFHDSWANSSKDAGPGARQTSTGQQPKEQVHVGAARRDVVYQATLGVPLEGEGSGSGDVTTMDQSFTQIGICHPKTAPSISTPVSSRIDFTFNMSRIPGQTEAEIISHSSTMYHPQNAPTSYVPKPARKRSAVSAAITLSTIKEESSSLKSSCSSNSTTSSQSRSLASSQSSHESVGHTLGSDPHFEVNPFLPEFVHKMLNALSPGVLEKMCMVSAHLPQLVQGRSVTFGKSEYGNVKKVTSGGFGAIYTCKQGKETKVLKVQKPPLKWEMAIISELHSRLCSSNLQFGSACFVDVEQSFLFDNASVMVLPHYHLGSMLDLVNAHHPQRVNESFVFYYASELLEMVASLHHCGILHTDIKPDNLMIKDVRSYGNFVAAKGHGLCLLDFGRAVDLTAFPDETMFQGSCETEGFQCTQMLEGKPWKYEVDYFGIAATVHVLLTGQYMSVFKDTKTSQYQLQKPLPRTRNTSLWSVFFNCLLNTTQPLPLSDMAQELYAKVKSLKNYMFSAYVKGTTEAAIHYLSQRS